MSTPAAQNTPAPPATFDAPLAVECAAKQQAGQDIVAGDCPMCGNRHAVSAVGSGRLLCACGNWIDLQKK